MQKKLLFIFNPTTGGGRLKTALLDILVRFSQEGYLVHTWPTKGPGDARAAMLERGAGYDLVVCCGGDGTLNEVADGLLQLETRPVVGYIPGGTTCDFASSLDLPKNDMLAAVEHIVHPKEIFHSDLGRLNGRGFVYVAAFGAFTNVPYKTSQKQKNFLGHLAYMLEGLQQLPKLEPNHLKITCDGERFDDEYLLGMVTNSTSVAGFSYPTKEKVRLDDGLFEVILVKSPHKLGDLGELSAAVLGGSMNSHLLTVTRAAHIQLAFDGPVDWTLDGEFGGTFQQAAIEVEKAAFPICI